MAHDNSSSPEPSWGERVVGAARSAIDRAETYGHAAVQALVLDDWKALTDARSTPLERIVGGLDLASWAIPEGKVAEIAGHALAKVAEQTAAHLATVGAEHAAEHLTVVTASAARWAERSENAKIAEQHAMNPSKIWDRALTETERRGEFENKHDLTAMLGPARERGGPKQEWHHIVESNTESRFGPERVQNVDNVVAIERDPSHAAITRSFQTKNPRLGLDAEGKEQSLRTFLKDKPWERHVAEGEQSLRDRGLDPDKLRPQTVRRFEERVELHDRLLGRSPEPVGASLPGTQAALHVERDGVTQAIAAGRRFEGTIQSVDGDRITQHIGRGETVTWSREELSGHFDDPKALDAMMQPGNYVNVGASRDGVVNVRERLADQSWQSLGNQLPSHPESPGHDLNR